MNKYLALLVVNEKNNDSGYGYYTTYVGDDFVVKKYDDKEFFEEDIKKHEDLDDLEMLPRMLANFRVDEFFYLVLEKIDILCHHKRDPSRFVDQMEVDMQDDFDELIIKYNNVGYYLDDICAFNFGRNKNEKLIVLDEGCLEAIQ